MGDDAGLTSALNDRRPDQDASFERVLNTEQGPLLQIHQDAPKNGGEGTVPAFRNRDLWRFCASALDERLHSGVVRFGLRTDQMREVGLQLRDAIERLEMAIVNS